jgi:hypothetical protein
MAGRRFTAGVVALLAAGCASYTAIDTSPNRR